MKTAENIIGLKRLTAVWLSAVSLMVVMLVALQAYLEREHLLGTVTTEATAIGGTAAAAVVFNDVPAALEMLSAFHASDAVVEAALYRPDGERLAEYRSPRASKGMPLEKRAPDPGSAFSMSELRLSMPVLLNDKVVGTIALRASLEGVYAQLLRFCGALIAIFVLTVVGATLAARRVRQRLAEKEAARRIAERELGESRDQLKQMIAHREQLLEEEHKRLAVEIHDQLGQVLTAAMLNLRSLERSLALDEDARRQFEEVLGQLDESYHGMKNIATLLYPAVLKFGFRPAVEWLAGRLLKVAGINWRLEVEDPFPALEPDQSTALFRIVQEAFVNIVRHAHASNVRISLRHADGRVTLVIADDGQGFDTEAGVRNTGFGLIGMRERAESLHGRVTIAGRPGEGTRVEVVVPFVG